MTGAAWRRGPPLLAVPALLAAALCLLPVAYLVLRATGDARAWEVLARAQTLDLVVDTFALAFAVTASAIAIGVPLA